MERYVANRSRRTGGPSSSSSARDDRFRTFLARSFDALRREVPEAYARMCRRLDSRRVDLRVDGEHVAVVFARDEARIVADGRPGEVEVRTSRTAVLRVIDARDTLVSAVLADRLVLRGAPRDVLAFHDGLMAYVHGAVRARSFPGLLRQFRQRRRRTSMPHAGVGEDT
jgi:hypothetical protein